MLPVLAGALTAGLLGSPHCIGMCGGFVTACSAERGGVATWHLGRLGTYAILGGIAGAVGGFLPGPSWAITLLATVLLLYFSARLAGLLPERHLQVPGLSRLGARLLARGGLLGRLGFGALTGLLPCGLLYAALALPVALGDPLVGALAMVLFGLGTLPALSVAAAGLRRLAATTPRVRRGVAFGVLLAGLWSVGVREIPALTGGVADTPACHEE